jgi:hypothetical protein
MSQKLFIPENHGIGDNIPDTGYRIPFVHIHDFEMVKEVQSHLDLI